MPGPRITNGHVGTHADADADADAAAALSRVCQPHRDVDAGSESVGGVVGDGAADEDGTGVVVHGDAARADVGPGCRAVKSNDLTDVERTIHRTWGPRRGYMLIRRWSTPPRTDPTRPHEHPH